jgi:hypothetical protein
MNEKRLFESFNRLFSAENLNRLKDKAVYKDGNSYKLFEQYEITAIPTGFKVAKMSTDTVNTFSSLQYAVTWVVLDKRNLIYEENRVRELDTQLASLDVVIKSAENAKKKSKLDFLRYNRLAEARYKKQIILEELNSYMIQTKRWQLNKFKESSL